METALTGKQLKTEHMCTCIFMCGVSNKYNKAIKNVKKSQSRTGGITLDLQGNI